MNAMAITNIIDVDNITKQYYVFMNQHRPTCRFILKLRLCLNEEVDFRQTWNYNSAL